MMDQMGNVYEHDGLISVATTLNIKIGVEGNDL